MKKNVLIIGSGGREHALAWKISQSPKLGNIYVAPGNGGTQQLAENVELAADDIKRLIDFAKNKLIDLVVVGPDDSLALGIVDEFQKAGLNIFGPNRAASQIEVSKKFSKNLMYDAQIPTADFMTFSDFEKAAKYLDDINYPIVIKASGLSLGKGVYVCSDRASATEALAAMLINKKFGDASNTVIIEEYLDGPEISIHAICDQYSAHLFPPAQDHKPIFDGNKGPNTGGMGTITPVPWVSDNFMQQAQEMVVKPILDHLSRSGRTFTGCLYPGLKVTSDGIKVLEFNARFGDPECQSYMRLLKTDLLDILESCTLNNLANQKIEWHAGYAATIVLASEGYPGDYKKNFEIDGLNKVGNENGVVVFHAGTKLVDGRLFTNGGRVLNVTATGSTLQTALTKAYSAVEKIHFAGMYYRKDIGLKSI